MKLVQFYATQEHLADATKIYQMITLSLWSEDHVMEKMSAATTPSGILAVFEIPAQPHFHN